MMKNFTRGMGVGKKIYLPNRCPAGYIQYKVPGTVRNSLLKTHNIPNPYDGYNNEKSFWVDDEEWWFFRKFFVPVDLKGKFVSLIFNGTLFKGDVWINGHFLGKLKGMFNPKSFNVSDLLYFDKENDITVRLTAPKDAQARTMQNGLSWVETNPQFQLHSIAQCLYGWDWSSVGVPVGIWQDVKLSITGSLKISDPYINSKIISSQKAECNVKITVKNLVNYNVRAQILGSILERKSRKKVGVFKRIIILSPNESKVLNFNAIIHNPKLWWPNGLGKQNLYLLRTIIFNNNKESDKLSTQFGICQIDLVKNENIKRSGKILNKDSFSISKERNERKEEQNYPWTFKVNGKKLFVKGGNWVPLDKLLRLNKNKYEWLLKLYKEANFNFIRVWGGGLYETNEFYNLCDKYGILVWQGFLSNRNNSKIDRKSFLNGIKATVLRLRNHPSLALWCSGNEFHLNIKSEALIDSLAELLKIYDPRRVFHRASPYKGDDHYWKVWHGMQPYTEYRIVTPFRSEAGLSSPPVLRDYKKFTPFSLLWSPDTTFYEYHGESKTRFLTLVKLLYYANQFGKSSTINELITKSQLYQALGDEFNMEFCRENKFRNSGCLVWQYDDTCPCISWSIVDWYGVPKPSYYYLKRACRLLHVSADFKQYLWRAGSTFKTNLYLLNDTPSKTKNLLFIGRLITSEGKILKKVIGHANSEANTSTKLCDLEYQIPNSMKGNTFFVSVELKDISKKLISSVLYPIAVSKTNDLSNYNNIFSEINKMPSVQLNTIPGNSTLRICKSGLENGTIKVLNATDHIAYFIEIKMLEESDSLRISYSNNYISLLPREAKTINFKVQSEKISTIPKKIHFEISGINCSAKEIEMGIINDNFIKR